MNIINFRTKMVASKAFISKKKRIVIAAALAILAAGAPNPDVAALAAPDVISTAEEATIKYLRVVESLSVEDIHVICNFRAAERFPFASNVAVGSSDDKSGSAWGGHSCCLSSTTRETEMDEKSVLSDLEKKISPITLTDLTNE